MGAVGVAEEDPDGDALAGLVGDDAQEAEVFGEEQARVDQDAYLLLGGLEEALPCLAGDG